MMVKNFPKKVPNIITIGYHTNNKNWHYINKSLKKHNKLVLSMTIYMFLVIVFIEIFNNYVNFVDIFSFNLVL